MHKIKATLTYTQQVAMLQFLDSLNNWQSENRQISANTVEKVLLIEAITPLHVKLAAKSYLNMERTPIKLTLSKLSALSFYLLFNQFDYLLRDNHQRILLSDLYQCIDKYIIPAR